MAKNKILTRKSLPTLKQEEELPQPDVEKEEEKVRRLQEENKVLKKEGMLHEEYQGQTGDELTIDSDKVIGVLKKEVERQVEEQLKSKEWCNRCEFPLTLVRGKDWKCEKCGCGWSY